MTRLILASIYLSILFLPSSLYAGGAEVAPIYFQCALYNNALIPLEVKLIDENGKPESKIVKPHSSIIIAGIRRIEICTANHGCHATDTVYGASYQIQGDLKAKAWYIFGPLVPDPTIWSLN